jgi:YidC/Oxa1 family membrane protein insertase
MNNLLDPIAKPIADVLAAFYAVIPNYGVAILLLSVVWMIVIAPLTLKSTRSMLALQALQPELNKLKERHKNDKQAFAQAQMELMRERNVSPFGSCLPMLLPLPVFFALFRVIDGLSHHAANGLPAPEYLNPHTAMYKSIVAAGGHINAFGLDLAKNALSSHSSVAAAIPYFVLLLIMIGTQYWQTAMTMNRNQAARDNPQMRMMKYLPIVFGIICIRFPAGVILYYAMSNVCRIVQQWAMYRYDPKVKALVTEEVSEVEAKTHDIDTKEAGNKRSAQRGGRGASSDKAEPSSGGGRRRLGELLAGASEAARAAPDTNRRPPDRGNGQGKGGRRPGAAPGKSGAASSQQGGRRATSDRNVTASNGQDSASAGTRERPRRQEAGTSGTDRGDGAASPAEADRGTRAAGDGTADLEARRAARRQAPAGARTSPRTVNRNVQPNKPTTGGRNIPAQPNRSKRRRKGR